VLHDVNTAPHASSAWVAPMLLCACGMQLEEAFPRRSQNFMMMNFSMDGCLMSDHLMHAEHQVRNALWKGASLLFNSSG
jgi:hypothetical protein